MLPRSQSSVKVPEIESLVIAVVADLIAEIRPAALPGMEVPDGGLRGAGDGSLKEAGDGGRGTEVEGVPVSVHSQLEEDLGLFSLEQVELIQRLGQAFGIPLSVDVLRDVHDVGDLVALVQRAPRSERHPLPAASTSSAAQEGAPPGSLAYSLYVMVVIVPFILVLWIMLHVVPHGRAACRLLRIGARLFLRAAGMRLDVRGATHLQGLQSAVLVSNHESYIDSIVMIAALPIEVIIVANEKLRRSPLPALVIRTARYVIVDRTSIRSRLDALPSMVAALRHGALLLVFPEMTFDPRPELLPFRLGAFAAAAEAMRPVVPIAVRGTRHILPSGGRLLSRGTVAITIGTPIHPQRTGWTETLRLRDEAREWIERSR